MNLLFGIIAFSCQMIFAIAVVRNMIRNKSITAWLMPEGTTKTEKITMGLSFPAILIFAVLGAIWGRI